MFWPESWRTKTPGSLGFVCMSRPVGIIRSDSAGKSELGELAWRAICESSQNPLSVIPFLA